jgi:hypothetical protein
MLFPENIGEDLSIDEVSLSQGDLFTFITNKKAYKIIARFEEERYEGLRELSRKPRGLHPNATNERVVNNQSL